MSYTTIEAGVQTLLQGLSAFDNADVTLGDYRILDGGSPPYIILRPGAFEHKHYTAPTGRISIWVVVVELVVRFFGDGTEQANLKTHMQSIVDEIDKYPTLNAVAGVVFALVTSGEAPVPLFDEEGEGPFFLMQRLLIEVKEKVTASGGEYA